MYIYHAIVYSAIFLSIMNKNSLMRCEPCHQNKLFLNHPPQIRNLTGQSDIIKNKNNNYKIIMMRNDEAINIAYKKNTIQDIETESPPPLTGQTGPVPFIEQIRRHDDDIVHLSIRVSQIHFEVC